MLNNSMTVQYSVETKILKNEKLCASVRTANNSQYQTLADQNLLVSNEIPAVFGLYVWKIFSTKGVHVPLNFLHSQNPLSLPFRMIAMQANRISAFFEVNLERIVKFCKFF